MVFDLNNRKNFFNFLYVVSFKKSNNTIYPSCRRLQKKKKKKKKMKAREHSNLMVSGSISINPTTLCHRGEKNPLGLFGESNLGLLHSMQANCPICHCL